MPSHDAVRADPPVREPDVPMQQNKTVWEEEKILDRRPDVNLPALLTRDALGG
jgi:hypothetical protein